MTSIILFKEFGKILSASVQICKCRAAEGNPTFMKSVYQNSIFSKVVNPHLFIDFAFLYLNGMEQNKMGGA
jgi:hypothetical protein